MNTTTKNTISAIAFEPAPGIPTEDYRDILGLKMCWYEVHNMLVYGNFPPGMILLSGGHREKVIGDYGTRQELQAMA
jgi:hypothetical protein